MYLDSIKKGPYKYKEIIEPTNLEAEEPEKKKLQSLADVNAVERKQAECDVRAANIILQGLPNNIYALLNHNKTAKSIWDRVKALMDGTKWTKQEREMKLADEFDMFTSEKGEMIQSYYLRFAKLMNDILINHIKMSLLQINTEMMQMRLELKEQQEVMILLHSVLCSTTTLCSTKPLAPQQPFEAHTVQPQSLVTPTSTNSELAIPTFLPTDDPIACLNKDDRLRVILEAMQLLGKLEGINGLLEILEMLELRKLMGTRHYARRCTEKNKEEKNPQSSVMREVIEYRMMEYREEERQSSSYTVVGETSEGECRAIDG
ncbi:hypothetical protein Tco_0589025 [Tanacetum coccineum]